jgi:hypothetical protein
VDRPGEIRDEDDRPGQDGDEDEIATGVIRLDLAPELGHALADLGLREVHLSDPRVAY